jgi:hypothetical protein
MRFALAALLMAHGVAHLVGFVVPWRLVASQEVAYRTTILASAIDVGDAGIRMLGIVWLLAAAAFVLIGCMLLSGVGVRAAMFYSLSCCALLDGPTHASEWS